ncbi:MAG: magnesium transporter CorA family protein [Candidatus Parcubacteria bacterium]|nr:magnesium transporter CorA family protein [Candidatus Parcubacteria bacterium]
MLYYIQTKTNQITMSQTKIIKTSELSWLDISFASEKELDYLRKKFKFDDADLADSLAHRHAQRPKILIRPNYIFMVIIFPIYNRKTREITPTEIDLFITSDHLISIHYNQIKPLIDFFEICAESKTERESYLSDTSIMLLYEILNRVYLTLFPMLDHLSLDINNIERNIFAHKEREMVQEILVIKRNIVYFRKIMQSHRMILSKLIRQRLNFIREDAETDILLHNLPETVQDIWETLDIYQKTIDALEDTNNALVSFKLNDIMRTLTIFSVICFPLTLMAAVFGMNVVQMPFINNTLGFWEILGLMAMASVSMYLYFRYKKWI